MRAELIAGKKPFGVSVEPGCSCGPQEGAPAEVIMGGCGPGNNPGYC